jgi:hypothetical protein
VRQQGKPREERGGKNSNASNMSRNHMSYALTTHCCHPCGMTMRQATVALLFQLERRYSFLGHRMYVLIHLIVGTLVFWWFAVILPFWKESVEENEER